MAAQSPNIGSPKNPKRRNLRPGVPNPPEESPRWEDLRPEAQARVEREMKDAGASMPQRAADYVERSMKGSPAAQRNAKRLAPVVPHLQSTNVTPRTASNRRVAAYERGRAAAQPGDMSTAKAHFDALPAGTAWFFEHHRDVRDAAEEHGFHPHRAIAASASMSPQNSPDNEKAAVSEIMKAHSSGAAVHFAPELVSHLAKHGVKVNPRLHGQKVRFADMDSATMASLSGEGVRHKVEQHTVPEGAVDQTQIGRGGTKGFIGKATDIVRGDRPHETAQTPATAPKVWAYQDSITRAVPDSDVHSEYLNRAITAATGQGTLDLHGLRHSREGMLNPEGHTVEDTWMNSVTMGQPNKTVGRASLQKVGGSMDGNVSYPSSADEVHAYNNRASRMAARTLSRKAGGADWVGAGVPAAHVQETVWTQARRETGKDPEFNAAQQQRSPRVKATEDDAQGRLF